MNSDQLQSAIRTVLKIGGGILIAKGLPADLINGVTASPDLVSLIAGIIMSLIGAVQSHVSNAS